MNDAVETRIASREADIVGKPARVAPLDRKAAGREVIAATVALRSGVVGDTAPLPLDAIPEIMFVLGRYPDIWNEVMNLGLQVQARGRLPARDRQFAILRTAWLLAAPYEWGEHVKHSKRIGITSAEIERVTLGPTADGWTPHEAAVVAAADELRHDAMITDATWNRLAEHLDDAQMFELLVLIGHFTNVAYFQNSLRLRLEKGNVGLRAR